jgi:chitinase
LAAVSTYGADGLDLDWEPIASTDHADLIALVQALRTDGPAGLLLTMPVAPININIPPSGEGPLFSTLYPLLDQLSVMSYGMAYDYGGWYSWFSSALTGEAGNYPTSVASSVNYYLGLGVPAAKLGVGVGFYGECFKNVTTPRTPLAFGDLVSADDNTMTYAHIATAYIPNMTYHYDAVAHAPWLTKATPAGPEGCTYLTYEDPASVAAKGAYVLGNGLGGTIIWTIGEGHISSGNDPLLDAIGTAFLQP